MYPAFFSENQIRYFHIFVLCFFLAETDVIKYTYSSPCSKKVVLLEWERSLWSGDKGPDCLFFSEATGALHSKDVAIVIFVMKSEYSWCLWKLFLSFAFINNDCQLTSAEKYILIQINISFQYILLYFLLQLFSVINIYQKLYLDIYQKLYFDKNNVCMSFSQIVHLSYL